MARRAVFENSSELGVFCTLTNSFCLIAQGKRQYQKAFETALSGRVPICYTSVASSKIIGRLTAGNTKGLLLPNNTTDKELQHIRNTLPSKIAVRRVDEKLSALGNCILCNDSIALIHPDLDNDTEEIIADVLDVEVIRQTIHKSPLVGSFAAISNTGGLLYSKTTKVEMKELASLLEIPLMAGTVNRGSGLIGSGIVVNDWVAICGMQTTVTEVAVVESIFKLKKKQKKSILEDVRSSIIDSL